MSNSRLAVSSELYDEYSLQKRSINTDSCTQLTVKFLNYPILQNGRTIEVDEDGDFVVERNLQHNLILDVSLSTQISGVGLQLWRGALLLSDFLIHHRDKYLIGQTLLELGAGVGLTSIIASMFASRVIATDINQDGILERIKSNFNLNSRCIRSEFCIERLDFYSADWSPSLASDIKNSQIIIAADVIYDNELTEAFINILTTILKTSKKTVFIALEKRYVFTIDDLDTVAPCYEYFQQQIKQAWNKPPMSQWRIDSIDINFPQYLDYERNKHLIMWQIESN